jgi:hypothetical protein
MARTPVVPGRFTAEIDGDFVVLLIGFRLNRPLRGLRWMRQLNTMNTMLKDLSRHPEKGLLGVRYGMKTMVQYWRSFEHLEAFARDADDRHGKVWREIYRDGFLEDGSAGIWHETFKVRAGEYEAVYGNMPAQGLAAISGPLPLGSRTRAGERIAAARHGMSLRDFPQQQESAPVGGAESRR